MKTNSVNQTDVLKSKTQHNPASVKQESQNQNGPYVLSTKKVDLSYYTNLPAFPDYPNLETSVREFWQKLNVPLKYLNLNKDAENQFIFYDGPITANNPMGVHHAWGRTLKDVYLRYNTAKGRNLRYQNGFDCQGLWVEVEVEKSLKLNSKKEIFDFGLEKFKQACMVRVQKYGALITEQSQLLGQFMDWDNSYWTYSDNNIEHIWYFLAECYKKGWLYKGTKVMPWCPRCGTSLSQHEQSDSYEKLTHPSVFVAFSVKQFSKTFMNDFNQQDYLNDPEFTLVVWTTTPWTLPANVAVAVHPELSYAVLKPKSKDFEKSWLIVGENAFSSLTWLQMDYKKEFSIQGNVLVGTTVEGPCQSFVPKQSNVSVKVVAWSDVSDTEGTGLVHIAP
ncbi:MAG: class I tRNA ligase family protein, partial [Candidatus Hodarchaeales archaeon]